MKLLRKHIEAGRLSKPDGVPLYYPTGKSKAGITARRCVRGTSSTGTWCVFCVTFLSLAGTATISTHN